MSDQRQKVVGVIPARYGSTRFEGKILADLAGKPMIQWVWEQAGQAKLLDDLFVATDDERIRDCVEGFGGHAVMTGDHHQSGTDRIAEAVENIEADIVINVQGDQPLLDPLMIDEVARPMIDDPDIPMATIKSEYRRDNPEDPGLVTVVTDERGFALYFSRSVLPYPHRVEGVKVYEHMGIYGYRKDFLLYISKAPQGHLEKIESLEQLRVLERGHKILVVETKSPHADLRSLSVDFPEDLAVAEAYLKGSAQ